MILCDIITTTLDVIFYVTHIILYLYLIINDNLEIK